MGLQIGRGVRVGRGVRLGRDAAATVGPTDPLTVVTSVPPVFWVVGDLGVTLATGVSVWADQSGNGNDFVQTVSAPAQPTLVSADPDFGGRDSLLGDGVNDYMTNVWTPPAPGTTPSWFFLVFEQISWTAGKFIFAGATGSSIVAVAQSGVVPAMSMLNSVNANNNAGAALGSAVRVEVLFGNSTSDYLKLGSSKTTGVNAGNNTPTTGLKLFTRNNGTTSQTINAKVACFGCWAGEPTAPEKAALDAWVTAYYGGGVGV